VVVRNSYDAATKLWTTVCAVAIAALVDWCAIAVPVRHDPPREAHLGWWTAALVLVVLPPLAWLIEAIVSKVGNAIVLWALVLAVVLTGQLLVHTAA
jgi:hypothetical protein